MTGGTTTGEFYGLFRFGGDQRMPATENDHGTVPTGRHTTTDWAEQFFGAGAVFNSAANPGGPDLGRWAWTYTAAFGTDSSCPHVAISGWTHTSTVALPRSTGTSPRLVVWLTQRMA